MGRCVLARHVTTQRFSVKGFTLWYSVWVFLGNLIVCILGAGHEGCPPRFSRWTISIVESCNYSHTVSFLLSCSEIAYCLLLDSELVSLKFYSKIESKFF